MAKDTTEPLLVVRDLKAGFETDAGLLVAVDDVDFSIERGKTLGIVGESGCGKSVSALSLIRLLPQPMGKVLGGEILFDGKDLRNIDDEGMHGVRGGEIGMIFQEPMTALNPVHTIGRQLMEAVLIHQKVSKQEALRQSVEMLDRVKIPAAEIRVGEYPHQLSGGMRQRVMIAMALINKPKLLIADEPTTALDVTVQAQILALIDELQAEMEMAVILITHDLAVIAENTDEVAVMYAGRIVERAAVGELFKNPLHPYTQGLLDSIPRMDSKRKQHLKTIEGMVPALAEMPTGCRFAPRCSNPHGDEVLEERPKMVEAEPGHWVEGCACFWGRELKNKSLNYG
ncbi:MAG: ABC transporter ATP-binding protein [Verrucomicrobiales bacterium]|nr:ABC transporter ATP-binding protein [Verrucomicrobiales bacterium]